ncbi:MAG TPA: TetR/AcrR family transcriptional regulator [Candidatus Salinicoccus stercoripullorum]|uniref:TetR/AcrR family transcriptional regulator n=1 Tax=Candidatus Salinicoccus stercoripullorum TaxID=2838756 RepID=A0A9D1QF56_9STAP|nr:TetR/AcrR family transcriptional regulator [Candidatus Salinicoccus stercoripullorum]
MSFIQEQRREQILKSCIEELAASGFRNLTFKNIAERAGINPSLVSYHFKSKTTLLFALLEYIFSHKVQYVANAVSEDESTMKRIRQYIDASLRYQRKFRPWNIALIEIIFNARTEDNKAFYLMEDDEPDGLYMILIPIIEEGIDKGDFNRDTDIKTVSRIINGAIDEMILAPGSSTESDKYGAVLFSMVEGYLKAEGGE